MADVHAIVGLDKSSGSCNFEVVAEELVCTSDPQRSELHPGIAYAPPANDADAGLCMTERTPQHAGVDHLAHLQAVFPRYPETLIAVLHTQQIVSLFARGREVEHPAEGQDVVLQCFPFVGWAFAS